MKNKEQQFYEFLKKHRAYKRWMRLKTMGVGSLDPDEFVNNAFIWPSKEAKFWIKISDKWNEVLKKDLEEYELYKTHNPKMYCHTFKEMFGYDIRLFHDGTYEFIGERRGR